MNRISIIAIILLICSCGTSRKITQTETHSKVNIESSFLDTSKRSESWEVIVNSVVKEIDLSKISIITYFPEKDNCGKQLIKQRIEINKNKIYSGSIDLIESQEIKESNKIISKDSFTSTSSSITSKKEKKSTISLKIYILLFFALCISVMLVLKK